MEMRRKKGGRIGRISEKDTDDLERISNVSNDIHIDVGSLCRFQEVISRANDILIDENGVS